MSDTTTREMFPELFRRPDSRAWQLTIEFKQFLSDDESDENARKVGSQIADLLEANLPTIARKRGIAAQREAKALIEDFRLVTELDELNEYLNDLYDWGDDYRVWFGLK